MFLVGRRWSISSKYWYVKYIDLETLMAISFARFHFLQHVLNKYHNLVWTEPAVHLWYYFSFAKSLLHKFQSFKASSSIDVRLLKTIKRATHVLMNFWGLPATFFHVSFYISLKKNLQKINMIKPLIRNSKLYSLAVLKCPIP